jgi:hypothetical protein
VVIIFANVIVIKSVLGAIFANVIVIKSVLGNFREPGSQVKLFRCEVQELPESVWLDGVGSQLVNFGARIRRQAATRKSLCICKKQMPILNFSPRGKL